MKIGILIAACLAVVGCKTYPLTQAPPISGSSKHLIIKPYIPEINESGLFHLSCTDKYPNGRSVYTAFDLDSETKISRAELAQRHYVHAAMANNVYRAPPTKPIFVIPNWHLLESKESESGFGVDVYGDKTTVADSQQIAIAYRGTNFTSPRDWVNNLAFREPAQYKEAYKHLKAIKAINPDAEFIVTGHSLGGGIALNMSLRFDGVGAVAFNSSPRIRFGNTSRTRDNYRASIYEVGEVLDIVSGPWTRLLLPEDTVYGNYNFLDYRLTSFSPVPEHGIYEMTRGLTLVAMTRGSIDAQRLFAANINRDEALQKDTEHCRAWFP